RKNFKDWQEESRWNLKVLGLTLPTLEAPTVVGCGRDSCTVRWVCSFAKRPQDTTTLGFNVTWAAAAANASLALRRLSGHAAVNADTGDPHLSAEPATDHALLAAGITDAVRYTLRVGGGGALLPGSLYSFAVALIYGDVAGPPSAFSKAVRTAAVTAPRAPPRAPEADASAAATAGRPLSVRLAVPLPADDGGAPLEGIHVMLRSVGEHVPQGWHVIGVYPGGGTVGGGDGGGGGTIGTIGIGRSKLSIDVANLLPGVTYQFKFCLQNRIGTSPWSAPSEPVTLPAPAPGGASPHLGELAGFHSGGGGGPHVVPLPNVSDPRVYYAVAGSALPGRGFDPFEREVHGPVVTVDDRAGTVTAPDLEFEEYDDTSDSSGSGSSGGGGFKKYLPVWAGHWSPRAFLVTAEAVEADPFDAAVPLRNAALLRGRVAIVGR
ncbi:unnamed protein product, partial [Phaeothamnion confervicola]